MISRRESRAKPPKPMPAQNENADGDELSVAGWVYADLLLALSIVALGATSFLVVVTNLPEKEPGPSSTTIPTTTVPEIQVANLSCDELVFKFTRTELETSPASLGARFDNRVRQYADANGLRDAKVGIMLLFGGYDTQSERTSAGKKRADDSEPILRSNSQQLRSVEARTGGASRITQGTKELQIGGPEDFAIVAYLVYDGDPKLSGC
ncbi:MAG: hypothetical protein FJ267_19690 [Planctomycetes bacterium]|nr:hypothetical protein [Planctomycetota bacterium]